MEENVRLIMLSFNYESKQSYSDTNIMGLTIINACTLQYKKAKSQLALKRNSGISTVECGMWTGPFEFALPRGDGASMFN